MVIYKNIRRFCRCIFVALCIAICIVSIFATEVEYDGYVVKLSQPMPIMSTFGADGEAIKELEYHDSVYVVEDAAIIDELIKSGIVVFADVPFEVCYERIKHDSNRPLVAEKGEQGLLELYNKRYPIYEKHSKIKVDCNNSPLKCVELIKSEIHTLVH